MGEHDKQLKVYLNDSRRYADMINAGIFGGRQMVLPEDLMPEGTVRTKVDTDISKERTSNLAIEEDRKKRSAELSSAKNKLYEKESEIASLKAQIALLGK